MRKYALISLGCLGQLHFGRDTMPKAKPTQVIVHRIELQEKEREFLETLQVTQSIKNIGFAAAGASVPVLGFMSYKAWKEWKGQEEGTVFDFFSKWFAFDNISSKIPFGFRRFTYTLFD